MEDNPPFRLALWGYDRPSVDAAIAHLRHQVEEGTGPAEPAEPPLRAAGAEAAAMLARAAELAEDVGRRAEEQARRLVADAEARARDTLTAADERAAEVVAGAERAAQDAEARWRAVARDLLHLRDRLDEVLPPADPRHLPEADLLAAGVRSLPRPGGRS